MEWFDPVRALHLLQRLNNNLCELDLSSDLHIVFKVEIDVEVRAGDRPDHPAEELVKDTDAWDAAAKVAGQKKKFKDLLLVFLLFWIHDFSGFTTPTNINFSIYQK